MSDIVFIDAQSGDELERITKDDPTIQPHTMNPLDDDVFILSDDDGNEIGPFRIVQRRFALDGFDEVRYFVRNTAPE